MDGRLLVEANDPMPSEFEIVTAKWKARSTTSSSTVSSSLFRAQRPYLFRCKPDFGVRCNFRLGTNVHFLHLLFDLSAAPVHHHECA